MRGEVRGEVRAREGEREGGRDVGREGSSITWEIPPTIKSHQRNISLRLNSQGLPLLPNCTKVLLNVEAED